MLFGSPPDAALYRRVAEAFPEAWIEDPALTPETTSVLEPYRDRITWDAGIHEWSASSKGDLDSPERAHAKWPVARGDLGEYISH